LVDFENTLLPPHAIPLTPRLTGPGKFNTKGAVAKTRNTRRADSLKQLQKIIRGWWGNQWFCGTGWLLAVGLSCWAAPRIYHRLISQLPAVQSENWEQTLAEKKRELSSPWQDPRPLILLAGDSQIELGDWYDLFAGGWAVRNCGLSRAKIADVTQLVSAIGDPHPKMVVLMCGINNLGAGEPQADCLRDYEALLATVRSHLQPETILVLAVMPVRESAVDRASHEVNVNVNQFNTGLAACCRRNQVLFLNANAGVMDANGGLASELTPDGLHLNAAGYRRLAGVIAPHLKPLNNAP
jgi:lysophospholipase L1-like esterase